jgi:spore germination protein YaaH
MLKRMLLIFVLIALLFTAVGYVTATGNGNQAISVHLNGTRINFDTQPMMHNYRTMVPFRALGEAMGASVYWLAETRQILAIKDKIYMVMTIGSDEVLINNITIKIDTPPMIVNDRTLVPVRFFSQAFGYNVIWNQDIQRVDITMIGRNNKPVKHVLAWYSGRSFGDYQRNIDKVTSTAFMWYTMDTRGNLLTRDDKNWGVTKPSNYGEILDIAKENGVKAYMMVFNVSRTELPIFLASPSARTNLINQIYENVLAFGYDGVNIDFEDIPPTNDNRNNLNAFMRELYGRLKPIRKTLSIALPAMTERSTWFAAFDYKTLGENSDYIAIMAYDRSPANPVAQAPINWVRAITEYALRHVPKEKILLGIGVYGREWSSSGRPTILLNRQEVDYSSIKFMTEILEQYGGTPVWSETDMMHSYTYTCVNGIQRTIWFECARSINEKMKFVMEKDLGGIAIWRLGYMNEDTWSVIGNYIDVK